MKETVDYCDLIDTILKDTEISSIVLTNLFTRKPNWETAKSTLNKILETNPKCKNTVLAFVLYPALRWSLYGEDMADIASSAIENLEGQSIAATQTMLRVAFGVNSKLQLKARERYFATCHNIIDLIDDEQEYLRLYPSTGYQMTEALAIFTGEDEKPKCSRFELKKYLPKAIEAIHCRKGEVFDKLVVNLLIANEAHEMEEDDERLYVYHNINILLKEYAKLYWANDFSGNNISKILTCKTPQEVMEITRREDQLNSASTVAQFLLLITGSVALLKYSPMNGVKYEKIMRMLMSNRQVITADGKSIFLREQEIAKHLGISRVTFCRLKKEAFTLLGALLWGYDGKALVEMLTDGKGTDLYFG